MYVATYRTAEVKLRPVLNVLKKIRDDEDGASKPTLQPTANSKLSSVPPTEEVSRPKADMSENAEPSGSDRGFPIPILGRDDDFSIFREQHAEEAADLVQFLVELPPKEFNDAMDDDILLQYNKDLLLYALRSALLHRRDTAILPFPPIWQLTVRKFFKTDTLRKISSEVHKKNTTIPEKDDEPVPTVKIELGFSGNERDIEHNVAYFREDLGMNSHHWHWHAVYPTSGFKGKDGRRTFKDRQGELFYYMHQQMLARYDAERLSNDLNRVLPLCNFREPIKEGYAPHLSNNGGKEYSMRPSGLVMKDTNYMNVNTMERWRERLYDAIDRGRFVLAEWASNDASDEVDIARLGDAIEANARSPNSAYYGNLHNFGHVMLSQVHDPDDRYEAPSGVLAYVQTAIRDPLFYRWHKFIDDIFVAHKNKLRDYAFSDLEWQGMMVESIKTLDDQQQKENTLQTFWNKRIIDLSHSIDFRNSMATKVELTHLDHKDFQYQIVVNNETGQKQKTTFRIFMAPTYGNVNRRPLSVNEQRRLFFEVDKFVTDVEPGRHTITRYSQESSVTIPFEKDQEEVDLYAEEYDKGHDKPTEEKRAMENYCGCGWPHHLLLPRGSHRGEQMDLFVMLTDWEKDKVEDGSSKCLYKKNHASYCGVFDKKYPDKKPMGFPFDRAIRRYRNLAHFCSDKTNMNHQTVTIEFDGED